MALELLILAAYLAALVDLFTKRGIAAVAVSTAVALSHSQPATTLFRLGEVERGLTLFISLIYLAISLYSIFYVKSLERRGWFWGWMDVFYASMLTFVTADHWALLLVGWGGLDLASWGLILTYREEEDAGRVGLGDGRWGISWMWTPSASALRAILTVEVGTAALMVGLGQAAANSPYISQWGGLSDLAAALILTAAFAKAAQLPFTDWLMTAMSAPTPVSALLHSSTMVKAGPILLLKLGPLMPGWAAQVAFTVGLATAAYGGLVALGQREPKVLLAASTASYLGLTTAFALKNPVEALWLIYAHGVAKATLFMAVGHAIHINHSRVPEGYPLVSKIAMGVALLTLVGITPLGAMAKAEAEWWLLFFSLLTSGYVGRLILKTRTVYDWSPMAWPYAALVFTGSFSTLTLINPFWAFSLGGLALAYLPHVEVLYRRGGLPVLYDLVMPKLFNAVGRLVVKIDTFVDRQLLRAPSFWSGIYSTVMIFEKAADLWLHDRVPELFRRTSGLLSGRSFEYYLYIAGVGLGVAAFMLLWIWTS
ncbi:MAG: proton-conducting transporter membrane subunit [Pyrobaculum sp.]